MIAAPVVDLWESAHTLKGNDHISDPAVLLLRDNGMIAECNDAGAELFGCSLGMLAWRHVSTLLPQLSGIALLQDGQINSRLHFLSHVGRHFEAVGMKGIRFFCELFFIAVEYRGQRYLRVIISPVSIR
jgi:hypothetical protein